MSVRSFTTHTHTHTCAPIRRADAEGHHGSNQQPVATIVHKYFICGIKQSNDTKNEQRLVGQKSRSAGYENINNYQDEQ